MVSTETIAETLARSRPARQTAGRLIQLALRGGGPDNITVIVADVVDVDFGDDAPIVGGAAGDGRDETPPPDFRRGPRVGHHLDPDGTAARAAGRPRTGRPLPRPAADAGRHRRRFAVLAGGGVLARMWVLQQYYVGANDDHVAIFQGVRGSVVGLPLQHLVEQTDIALTDLPEATRNTVRDGILVTQGGLAGAQGKVALLRGSMLAPCPVPGLVAPSAARSRRHRSRSSSRRTPRRYPAIRPRPFPPTRTWSPPDSRHHATPDSGPATRSQLSAGELR